MLLLHDNTTPLLPWEVCRTGSEESSDFMPLRKFGDTPKRQKILSEKGIAGGTMPPCLSVQTTGIHHRRSIAASVASVSLGQTSSSSSSGDLLDSLFNDNGGDDDDEEDDRSRVAQPRCASRHGRARRRCQRQRRRRRMKLHSPSSYVLRVWCITAFKNSSGAKIYCIGHHLTYRPIIFTSPKTISIGQSLAVSAWDLDLDLGTRPIFCLDKYRKQRSDRPPAPHVECS